MIGTRYVQAGDLWVPEHRYHVTGLGDAVSWVTKRLGLKECGGCSRRRATLNRWLPFRRRASTYRPIAGGSGTENLYFNSTECPHVGGVPVNSDHLFCDDFDHGYWFNDFDDPDLNNRGWLALSNSGTPYSPGPGASSVSTGLGGTGFASRADFDGGAVGSDANTAMHGFYPSTTTYQEVYYRFYAKFSAGWVFNGQQKWITWNSGLHTGIDFGGGPTHDIEELTASPQVDASNDSYKNPLGTPPSFNYIRQNLGNNITLTDGRWYYLEFRVKLNTFCATHPGTNASDPCRDGIWEVWANDCGASGVCTGTPTKRASYNNVAWRGQQAGGSFTSSGNIGTPWHDNWGNPSDGGTLLIDNIVASREFVGFIGGAGASKLNNHVRGWRR